MKRERIKLYKDRKGKWRWKYIGKNNEKIGASSEGFERRAGAIGNLRLVTGIVFYTGVTRGPAEMEFARLADYRPIFR